MNILRHLKMMLVLSPYLALYNRQIEICIVFSVIQTLSLQELQEDFDSTPPTDSNNNSTVNGTNSTISYIASNTLTVGTSIPAIIPNGVSTLAQIEDPIIMAPPIVNFHTVIIDMSGVCFVDLMGIKALGKVFI